MVITATFFWSTIIVILILSAIAIAVLITKVIDKKDKEICRLLGVEYNLNHKLVMANNDIDRMEKKPSIESFRSIVKQIDALEETYEALMSISGHCSDRVIDKRKAIMKDDPGKYAAVFEYLEAASQVILINNSNKVLDKARTMCGNDLLEIKSRKAK